MKTNVLQPGSTFVAAGLLACALAIPAAGQVREREGPIIDEFLLLNQGNRDAGLTTNRTITRDVGDRLFRLRAGQDRWERSTTVPAPAPSAKGGMAKGGMAKEPIVMTEKSCWEIYGSLFYYTEEYDRQFTIFRPQRPPQSTFVPPPVPIIVRADTEIDVWGGTIGADRRIGENWRLGLALTGASTDMDLSIFGFPIASTDVDTLSIMPYVSYYKEDALGSADFWADFLYGYSDMSYDMQLLGGLTGSPDGSAHTLNFNTGINFDSSSIVHGPHIGLRYIDGEIDNYTLFPVAIGIPGVDYQSLVSTVGYHVSIPIQLSGGTLVPQFRVGWEHEFEDDVDTLFGLPLAGNEEDVIVAGAGLGFYCDRSGWNTVLQYEGRFGDDSEGHYVAWKVGKEF
ncbi:outermembrane autotransporter barrel domain-containing protein [Haloferula helveola]|uniref:Outermembrane autotransporter barrel domain-containing protein n=1 Tax=Haloferula helveola TaxID=490095 RepID=A0ABN6H571_9BACT|nr:outermembrane autotransporter barrel domain-containing protein [Haloferula helveola]